MSALTFTKVVSAVAATGAGAPTLATDGIDVTNAQGLAVVVSADSGQTFTSGTVFAYAYLPVTANGDGSPLAWRWMRVPAMDLTPTASVRDYPSGDIEPLSGIGRLAYVPNVVVSSGAVAISYNLRRRQS